jgi:hypothetical protein
LASPEEQIANAALIAIAPEILEALELAESLITASAYEADYDEEEINNDPEIKYIRAVIAKAKGGIR